MNLLAQLQTFDGKHTSVLEELSARLPRSDDSVAQLLTLAEHEDTEVQVGATWILKRWHEEGVREIDRSVGSLIRLLKRATCWEVQLHLLQMLASLRVPARSLSSLERQLRGLMTAENKFVRAWALSVFAAIGDQHDALRTDVASALDEAEYDEAASVRARVRQIRKKHKWTAPDGRTRR